MNSVLFSRLQRLPISEVKIDRSFVLSAPEEPMNANIVEMVVRIGETMGARVVAEGVETQAHADFLAPGTRKCTCRGTSSAHHSQSTRLLIPPLTRGA